MPRGRRDTAEVLARAAFARHFGKPPRRMERTGGGLQNDVLCVRHAEGRFVIRIGRDPAKINAFIKEQWSMKAAQAAGVPVPEVLEVANDGHGRPYMISREVDGVPGLKHADRITILRSLGELAKRVHSVHTKGYGRTFDWSHNQLSRNKSFGEFLSRELDVESRLDTLRRNRMVEPARLARLAAELQRLARWRKPAVLNHGDLRLKNIIVDEDGRIAALLDWDQALSSAGPWWDLSIALHDLSIDEKQAFVEGYGLKAKHLKECAPAMRVLNVINYVPRVEELAAQKEVAGLEALRMRLSGAFDLYAL
ncbi:MAG TPA: phosphotransferase [Casimicrobiaceae bacterium]|nr:phosphotransferase [Casimicrobiaceae bacterium]